MEMQKVYSMTEHGPEPALMQIAESGFVRTETICGYETLIKNFTKLK
jgi:hypothetical protein